MSPKHIYIAVALVALAIVGGQALSAVISSRVDLAKFEQIQKDVAEIKQQAQDEREAARERERQRDLDLARNLAAIAAQKNEPVDYTVLQEMVAREIGNVRMESKTPDKEGGLLPDTPSAIQLQGDIKSFRDYMLDCKACKVERDSLKEGIANKQAEIDTFKTELNATTKERDAAVKAAKGGSVWDRVKRNSKWFAVGAGVGVVAGYAASR